MDSSTDQPAESGTERPAPAPACGVCATMPAELVARNTCPAEGGR